MLSVIKREEMNNEELYKEYNDNFKENLKIPGDIMMFLYREIQKEYADSMPYFDNRLKSWKSLMHKIENSDIKYESVHDMQDLIGVRIICLNKSAELEIVSLIKKLLKPFKTYDTQTRLSENEFGYSSIHVLGKINIETARKIDSANPTLYHNKKYEIQVRTMSEHIFSMLSHKFSYKSAKYIPSEIKRPLYRIAALTEIMDNEIRNFEEARTKYIEGFNATKSEEINIDNLQQFLKSKFKGNRDIGNNEDFEGLIKDLHHFNIKSIKDLNNLHKKNYSDFLKLEKKQLKYLETKAGKNNDFVVRFKKLGHIYSFVGAVRGILNQEFKSEWADYRIKAIDEPFFKFLKDFGEQK
jgi:putative GTP pyrophosphokinase